MKLSVERETTTLNHALLGEITARGERERIQRWPAEEDATSSAHELPFSFQSGSPSAVTIARLNIGYYRKILATELDKKSENFLLICALTKKAS